MEIDDLKLKIKSLEQDLQNPEIFNFPEKLTSLSKKYNQLKERLQNLEMLEEITKKIAKTEEILQTESDPELLKLAKEEIALLKKQKRDIEKKIKISSDDWIENKNVIIEIRAGTGGEEAALFAADLYRMYCRYAENKNWQVEILNSNRTDLGGFKEIIFKIKGSDVYKQLQHESGVHRVQRIPKTEKSGRIHTSTATVAVLPEVSEIDIKIKPSDLKIDTFRASGHGGQNIQKTETAVRITYLPTNLVVTCQDERSQQQNKERAMKILRARLFLQQKELQTKELAEKRRQQIGSAERAEKIRTYNFPQSRITDHRINKSWYNLSEVMDGKLDDIIKALEKFYETEASA